MKKNRTKNNTKRYTDIILGQHLYRVISNHIKDRTTDTEYLELKLDKVKVVGISCHTDKNNFLVSYAVHTLSGDKDSSNFPDSELGKTVFTNMDDAIVCASKAIDSSCFGKEVE